MINYAVKLDKYKSYDILPVDRKRRCKMKRHLKPGGIHVGEYSRRVIG
jgi:hypothetical protein